MEQPADASSYLWACGCLINDAGAHRGQCPAFRTVKTSEADGTVTLWWWPRELRIPDTEKED